ncbi:MAG: tyrosinase family protein [Cyclobacteriaceae bacterium]
MLIKSNTTARLVLAALAIAIGSLGFAQELAVRKNIDELSPVELATYEHAIQLMQDKSAENPYLKDGYAWQAWVHNLNRVSVPKVNELKQGDMNPTQFYKYAGDTTYIDGTYGYPGMCEHAKDLFFFWHRAQFYYFEKVLQNTDPDGTIVDSKGNVYPTKNLGVPFWNFTRKPTGVRFPEVFEDKSSVLYHTGRDTAAIAYPFTSPYLLAYLSNNPDWPTFGGSVNAEYGGYGTFESIIHNPMHSIYIGGPMKSPPTAAYDPIFYSFHAYIDYIIEAWIEKFGTENITSLNYYLRGEQPEQFNLPDYNKGLGDRPNMGQGELYLDMKKLGYTYDMSEDDKLISEERISELLKDKRDKELVFGKSKVSPFYKIYTTDAAFGPQVKVGKISNDEITIDKSKADEQDIYIYQTDNVASSYQVDVYIHPKKVKADIASLKFRERYFVNLGVAWLGGGHAHHGSMMNHKLNINLTEVMKDLYQYHDGETCVMTFNMTKL